MSKVGKIAKGVAIGLVLAIILNIALMAVIWFAGLKKYYWPPAELKAVRDYSTSDTLVPNDLMDSMQSSKRAKKYALGVNQNGDPVFLKPRSAFNAAKKDYKYGIKAMHKTFDLKHKSKTYYIAYTDYKDKIKSQDWEDGEKEQALLWIEFLEVYKNSFPENTYRR